ncbi:MAG: class I SAM-dependent methyltransferase [Planctomycetota bacterium]|nr:class I SAM-dependent methyltransferase [Planctomycetota bacterium]
MTKRSLCIALLAALVACQSAPANRDVHGPDDVESYIARLVSTQRLAELQPELVVSKLALPRDARVADIGCGPGVFALPFARACPDGVVYAVDVEPRQLDALRTQLLDEHIENVVPVLASYTDPHLPPAGIDLIFIADTYHHLEDRIDYLKRLRDDLAPRGRLAIIEYLPGDLPVGPPASHKLPEGLRERELAAAGFELAESFQIHEWHSFEVWRLR